MMLDRITRLYPITPAIPRREQGVVDVLVALAEGKIDMPRYITMTPQIHTLLGWSLAQDRVKERLLPLVGVEIPIMVSDTTPEPGWEVTW